MTLHVSHAPRRNICVLVLPTEAEALAGGLPNSCTSEQVWDMVFAQYAALTRVFAEPSTDVIEIESAASAARFAGMRQQLQGFKTICVRRSSGGAAAADPHTKLFVWCHTPLVQRCPVAARVNLENLGARPDVTIRPLA